jgi:outer membrane lipase/esterase
MGRTKLAVALTFALFAAPAIAKPFNSLWVFGDSTVDAGSLRVAPYTGDPYVDFYLAPTEPAGRTGFEKWGIGKPTSSPGPMNSEVFAALLGVTAFPQNQGGTNYAFSGARNALSNEPPCPGCGFPNDIPTTQQISNYLKYHKPTGDELNLISSGGNDIKYAVNVIVESPPPPPNTCGPNAQAYLTTAAQQLANAINSLQQRGAKYIMVANEGAASADSTLDACRIFYQTTIFNDLKALDVVYVLGGRGFKPLIESEPSTFGIDLSVGPACVPVPPNITTAYALVCSPSSPATRDLYPPLITSEEADDEHYATPAQVALGNYYYCLARFSWPSLFVGHNPGLPSEFVGQYPRLPYECSIFSSIIPYTGP